MSELQTLPVALIEGPQVELLGLRKSKAGSHQLLGRYK